jgi:hypothetical protein
MKKVYIASPYTLGDVAVNVRVQLETADQLMTLGFAPYVPLLTHFQHLHRPRPYEDWCRHDDDWIPCCDYLLRLPGESKGADREVRLAESLGIPVFYKGEDLPR